VILTGGAYWMAFSALGEKGHAFWAVTSLAMAAGLVAYLPISLNGIGTVEASGVAVFGILGIPPATVLAAYLVLRLLVFAVAWIPTAIWLLIIACSPEKKEAAS
jgi:uncharacterized membrane protein YbhN (UPF0104 family)